METKTLAIKTAFKLAATVKDGVPMDLMTDFNFVVKPVVKKFIGLKAIIKF